MLRHEREASRPAPLRGTRPRNRKDLLLAVAADLFRDHGYGNVSMKDVAAASNISPSSLYTHVTGKPELLQRAIARQIDRSFATLDRSAAPNLHHLSARLAEGILANRAVGVLWQRESRNLGTAARAELRKKMGSCVDLICSALLAQRPELSAGQSRLLAHCALGAVTSISFHSQSIRRDAFESLLQELCLRMLLLDPAKPGKGTSLPRSRRRLTRRDELADAAIALFAERGYSAVSVDDIGAAVGIAGPSVYKHVKSKHALLQAAFTEGVAVLRESMDAVLSLATDPADAVRTLTDFYVNLALDQADLVTVVIAEANQLDAESQHLARRAQHEYIENWVSLVQSMRAEDPVVTRIKVQAAQMVANDIGRAPSLHRVPGWRATVHEACWSLQL